MFFQRDGYHQLNQLATFVACNVALVYFISSFISADGCHMQVPIVLEKKGVNFGNGHVLQRACARLGLSLELPSTGAIDIDSGGSGDDETPAPVSSVASATPRRSCMSVVSERILNTIEGGHHQAEHIEHIPSTSITGVVKPMDSVEVIGVDDDDEDMASVVSRLFASLPH